MHTYFRLLLAAAICAALASCGGDDTPNRTSDSRASSDSSATDSAVGDAVVSDAAAADSSDVQTGDVQVSDTAAPPAITAVKLTPAAGGACTPYQCQAELAGASAQAQVSYRWTVDGVAAPVTTAAWSGALAPGKVLQCFAKAANPASPTTFGTEVASNTVAVAASGVLHGSGLSGDNEGLAAWNTDGTGAEPAKTGHTLKFPDCVTPKPVADYYGATADYAGINPLAKHGMHFLPSSEGFPNFAKALADNGWTLADVEFSYGYQSLGADAEGSDWSFAGSVETRYYTGGTWQLRVAGQPIAGGAMPKATMTVNYNDFCKFDDDVMSGLTDWTAPQDQSATASPAGQAVAKAWFLDVGAAKVRFSYVGQEPAVKATVKSAGRIGSLFNMVEGKVEVGTCP